MISDVKLGLRPRRGYFGFIYEVCSAKKNVHRSSESLWYDHL